MPIKSIMQFQTKVDIPRLPFDIGPCEPMLFLGSCFADSIGKRFQEERFPVTVNPYGVMYNPASVLHAVEHLVADGLNVTTAVLTLGTNHVYIEKATGIIVDNCQKRPQRLFEERDLTIDSCIDYLQQAVRLLQQAVPSIRVLFTVSPIRYAKYGFHESQLSKATLLLAVDRLVKCNEEERKNGLTDSILAYFPAYEILLDELRDYRFYATDMLHPSPQAVEYIWLQLVEAAFSQAAKHYLDEWKPLKEALGHRPFHPESPEYQVFLRKTQEKVAAFSKKYPTFAG